jgi:glutamate-5-semialdehyde dehydrogenase
MSETREQAERARKAFTRLSTQADRTAILADIVDLLDKRSSPIIDANRKDLEAPKNDLAPPLYKRLVLNESKLREVIDGVRQVAVMPDPVGRIIQETELDDRLILRKVQVPIGVIAMIFESRPDAVPQIASLAIRTGNAVLLKGGREAAHSNRALVDIIREALAAHGVEDAVQLISSREQVSELLQMDDLISLVIPRGSNELVRSIQERTRIPVLGHADGICHVFVDKAADVDKAIRIVVDAKAQYPAVCNAAETLLMHRDFPAKEQVYEALRKAGVELRMEADFGFEFLDLIISVHTVDSLDAALGHIQRYGSSHTDAIVTEDAAAAQRFLDEVDSAGVFWNASTRFADGFRYGFGAEVGISTSKTHARGPVGVEGLLIYKYQLIGNGHVVAAYSGENARRFTHRKLS